MKKLLIVTNVFWVSIFIFQACKHIKPIVGPDGLPPIRSFVCPSCTDYAATQGSYNPVTYGSTKGLSIATALKLSNDYKSYCQPALTNINVSNGRQDSRSAWFSLETLKQYIFNIEKSTCTKNCYSKMELGVRIYFGRYPDFNDNSIFNASSGTNSLIKADLSEVKIDNPLYTKNHTLFMVPTYDSIEAKVNGIRYHIDFDPWHMGADCKTPTKFSSLPIDTKSLILSPDQPQFGRLSTSSTNTISSYTSNQLLQNHGNLFPPDNSQGIFF